MAELKGQEIFSSGRWNNIDFTEADLDGMVRAFEGLNLAGKVPLKFGHDSAKPMKDGKPALGWVQRLYREGRRLMADFSNVPDAVMTAIREKLYKHVSIELLQNVKAGTREIPWVPDAVALLGADQPAVGILKELEALTMSARAALRFDARVAFTRDYHSPTGDKGQMDTIEGLRAELAAEKRRNHVAELRRIVTDAVNDKRVAPAALTAFSKYAGADDSESIMRFSAADITDWLRTNAPRDRVREQRGGLATRAERRADDDGQSFATEGQTNSMKFTALVDQVREELKIPLAKMQDANVHLQVLQIVQQRNPSLWQQHSSEPWGS